MGKNKRGGLTQFGGMWLGEIGNQVSLVLSAKRYWAVKSIMG